jgi:endoglucanase
MKLLEQLTRIPGVAGREHRVRAFIERYVSERGLFDELRTDVMGSLIARRDPRPGGPRRGQPTRVMVAAHMDQIGFLVSHISDDGYLRAQPVGAVDARHLFCRRVIVCATSGGDLHGVINPVGKPIHTIKEEDRKRVPDIEDFYIDLSLPADEVRTRVRLGDMVVMDGSFIEMGNSVVASCLDDRIGCWALIRAIEKLDHHDCEIHAAWTVQEELGSRGAATAAYEIDPDIGLCCDTTVCCKLPGVPDEDRVTMPGHGVAIQVADSSTIVDAGLIEAIEEVAQQNGIRCQRSLMLGGGQDGAAMQRTRKGVRTAVFACPVKHLHSVNEMAHKDDLASYPALVAAYLSVL